MHLRARYQPAVWFLFVPMLDGAYMLFVWHQEKTNIVALQIHIGIYDYTPNSLVNIARDRVIYVPLVLFP